MRFALLYRLLWRLRAAMQLLRDAMDAFGSGGSRHEVPAQDAAEDLWRQYYTSILNPARLNTTAMRSHMQQRFWRNPP